MNYDKSKHSTDEPCVFCNLENIKGVTELTKDVVMFEPLNPVVKGHRLFVHRTHTKHAGRSPKVSAEVFEQASKYAGEQARPFNIITSGGKDATQTVFHLHIHYVPRQKNDGLLLPWSDIQAHYARQEAEKCDNANTRTPTWEGSMDLVVKILKQHHALPPEDRQFPHLNAKRLAAELVEELDDYLFGFRTVTQTHATLNAAKWRKAVKNGTVPKSMVKKRPYKRRLTSQAEQERKDDAHIS